LSHRDGYIQYNRNDKVPLHMDMMMMLSHSCEVVPQN
jgi:hypothetical protein